MLFFRNKSLGAAHTQRKGITQGHDCHEVGVIERLVSLDSDTEFGYVEFEDCGTSQLGLLWIQMDV